MRSRLLIVVCIVLAAGIAVGSGAFSSVESEQGTTVETVGDDNAYMALDDADGTATATTGEDVTVDVVTATNRFAESVDITVNYDVTTVDSGLTANSDSGSPQQDSVEVGEAFTPSITFTCDSSGTHSATITFGVTATGDSVDFETTTDRDITYEITCEQQTTETTTTSS